MTTYVIPYLVSEREPTSHLYYGTVDPAGAEDCVPCSVVMAWNGVHPGVIPATKAAAEAIRHEAGYPATGPTPLDKILAAAGKLHNLPIPREVETFRDLWDALTPGHAAVVIGRPANLPVGNELRQYLQVTFTGEHCIYVQRRDARTRVFVLDPMAPAGAGFREGYWAPQADLAKFFAGPANIFGIATK